MTFYPPDDLTPRGREEPRPDEPPAGEVPTEGEAPRRGRARERIERRHQKPSPGHQPAARGRRMRSQIAPSDRFKLPEIKLPFGRPILYGVGSILLVIIVVVILGRLREGERPLPPNALWVGTNWTYQTHSDEDIQRFIRHLREHEIGTVYAWVSWLQADQTWRGVDNFENVKAFVRQFKQFYPESRLFGWVSFPVDFGPGTYRMDDETIQQAVADFSSRVIDEFGFDGVFLNIEPVWDGDQNFLSLLRRVRAVLGTATPISVAIPPDWSPLGVDIPVPPLIVPGTEWATQYKQSVALLVDEMAVMAYNSGLSRPEDYSAWVAYQVQAFAQPIAALGGGTAVVIGIPTYDAEPPGHDPLVENVTSAAEGVRAGLAAAGDAAAFVSGVAIYADWTTDDDEWAAFRRDWLGRR